MIKDWNKKLIYVFIASLVYLCYLTYQTYNNLTDNFISSTSLSESFLFNETLASKNYIDKIIEIKGDVIKMSSKNDRLTIFLKGYRWDSSVICDLEKKEVLVKKLHVGQNIVIKGKCMGFLNDVIILDCKLLKINLD